MWLTLPGYSPSLSSRCKELGAVTSNPQSGADSREQTDLSLSFNPWPSLKPMPVTHLRKSSTAVPIGQPMLDEFLGETPYSGDSRVCQATIKTCQHMPLLGCRPQEHQALLIGPFPLSFLLGNSRTVRAKSETHRNIFSQRFAKHLRTL